MLDISVAYNRYKFLGYEFLTWLWFLIQEDPGEIRKADPELLSLDIGNRLVLENRIGESAEVITIKGDDAGLEEGILALKKGAVVTEMNLLYKSGDYEWRFTLKGDGLTMASLRTPDTGKVETKEDLEGAVLEKIYLREKAVNLTDSLFGQFIRLRISREWDKIMVSSIRQWIHSND
ncbi:MAG TPA: hypothetical protein DCQ37_11170 [Desulfobacteraceae bacterium]|nr:hypothetical protein [Desulfobacteraceae bacterium]